MWADDKDNTPGIVELYYAKISDIETLPLPTQNDPTQEVDYETLVTIDAPIVMKPWKQFKQMYLTDYTGKIESEIQGELDGKSFMNKLEFFHPGNSAQILGFTRAAKNGNFVFIGIDADGKKRLFGTRLRPAKLETAPITTGAAGTDRKGGTFVFSYTENYPACYFTGNVDLTGTGYGSAPGETDFQTIEA